MNFDSASNDQHISCFHCPYGFLPGEKCLTEDDDFGHAQTCRFGFDNACESLIIGNKIWDKITSADIFYVYLHLKAILKTLLTYFLFL